MNSTSAFRTAVPKTPDKPHRKSKPKLKIVTQRARAKTNSKMAVSVTIAVAALLSLIVIPVLINTQLAVLAYQIRDARLATASVQEKNEELKISVYNASNPSKIGKVAQQKGLILPQTIGTIYLKTGKVVPGKPASGAKPNPIYIREDDKSPDGIPLPVFNLSDIYDSVPIR